MVALAFGAVPAFSATGMAAHRIPATIDPTGGSDVTADLQRFVESVGNGQTVTFPAGARYRIDGTLEWRDRTGVTLEGNGATLVAGTNGDWNRAHVRLIDGGGWTIRDLTVNGANPNGGRFDPEYQWQHGLDLRGVEGATLQNVTVADVFGDDIYIGLSTTRSTWSRDISIINCTGLRSGRMGIAITAARRVTVSGGIWSAPGLSAFDIEPNGRPGGADRILIQNTRVGTVSRGRVLDIRGSGSVSNVTLRDNRLTGTPLHVLVDQGDERPQDIVVEHNRSTVTFTRPPPAALVFRNTDGVTVNGNAQPLARGGHVALVATSGSTRVVSDQRAYRDLSHGPRTAQIIVAVVIAALLVAVLWRRRTGPRTAAADRSGR